MHRATMTIGGRAVATATTFEVRNPSTGANEVYGEFVAENCPSGQLPGRTTVFVDLPHEVMLVEIDALAVTG